MPAIFTTKTFDLWFEELKDTKGRFRIQARIDRAELGNFGDCEPVGEGVSEMREYFGSGWRMYYVERRSTLIIMLGGGDKATQRADISKAIALSRTIEE